MTRHPGPVLIACLLALPLAFAACGRDDGKPAAPAQSATAGPASRTAVASPSASASAAASPSRPADAAARFRAFELPAALAAGVVAGRSDARVTLEMFEDFQCPHCLAFTLEFEPLLMEEFVVPGKIKLQFRNYPVLGAESGNAALAATCAAAQARFWPFHKEIFLLQFDAGQLTSEKLNAGRFDRAGLTAVARKLNLDTAAFDTCLTAEATTQAVTADIRAATTAGIRGTPGFILNGKVLPTPATAAEWRTVLNAAIAGN